MGLKEEIQDIIGKKRKFLLLRIADVETDLARKMCEIPVGTYNSWTSDATCRFVQLYRRRDEFAGKYKQEAIQLLRRDNQLHAVMLEEKILSKIEEELQTGDYNLIRVPLCRDVYTKLVGDLDWQPTTLALTWEQRREQLVGRTIDGEVIEAETGILAEHAESEPVTPIEQANSETQETVTP
jgi:hypothetical protein